MECVDFLGDVHSATTFVKRDLGFAGQVGKHILLSYGYTMYSDENYSDQFRGMTSDSVALATHDPLLLWSTLASKTAIRRNSAQSSATMVKRCQNVLLESQMSLRPIQAKVCLVGLALLTVMTCHSGILYFLLNHRPNGTDNLQGGRSRHCHHSGDPVPYPKIKRLAEYWWDGDKEPRYGDVGTIRRNGYIYAYGHAKTIVGLRHTSKVAGGNKDGLLRVLEWADLAEGQTANEGLDREREHFLAGQSRTGHLVELPQLLLVHLLRYAGLLRCK